MDTSLSHVYQITIIIIYHLKVNLNIIILADTQSYKWSFFSSSV